MRAHIPEYTGHVIGDHIVPAEEIGVGLGGPTDGQRAAGADAQYHIGVHAGGLGQIGHILINAVGHMDAHGLSDHFLQCCGVGYGTATVQRVALMTVPH